MARRRGCTGRSPAAVASTELAEIPGVRTQTRHHAQDLRSRGSSSTDLTAGVIVGIVALPLAIAFAIASGVTPERGLYTAIVAGFLISALGG